MSARVAHAPRHRPSGAGWVRRLMVAVALFIAAAGVMLALFGAGDGPATNPADETPQSAEERAASLRARALAEIEQAERAMMDQDYGRARERVRHVRRLLVELERSRTAPEP